MQIRYPRPLRAGDLIGVTSPSSGVGAKEQGRLEYALGGLGERGFDVTIGECMDGKTHVSAPAEQRAAELMGMLLDPRIRAIVPPWGGETAIDLLPHLDFDAIAQAEPTWFVGYSDISTLLTPLTLLTGLATVHGSNLMDTPYDLPAPLLPWTDVVALPAGSTFRQASPGVHRLGEWDDWEAHPEVSQRAWNGEGTWTRLDAGTRPVDVSGRLIGGCIETLANLAGSRYGDTNRLRTGSETGVIVYVEASGDEALSICRNLHGMRLAGFFEGARAILVGRTGAPDSPTLTQAEAVLDALAVLGVPIISDVECGHVPPQLPIVNGALGRLVFTDSEQYLEQSLV
ncbi:peptidase S66 family protein [Cryobacterium roopkundense]|uniref:Muramoyltetrapeptide carboxypeptidase LdcA involved in peptidoglycan recycling n=1 Tax=Cryobacterium roopkundense TaxID=1001240 RepID=A0A099J5K5_9MICO|nr:S66 peptidase family protein [Cryobacterium roopkundense]KGJ73385.1 peptidase S66 family protein [Cryobacterium roopkundense]MBB5640119.1 muramoyltetrapeptide carboxypeptidase LdcA involved in peptidoglycan recycling [Cryobacterium roopkundense]